jgi:hypothetical protein
VEPPQGRQQNTVIKNDSSRVSNCASIFSDISELQAMEPQRAHLAHHDALTGLQKSADHASYPQKNRVKTARHSFPNRYSSPHFLVVYSDAGG